MSDPQSPSRQAPDPTTIAIVLYDKFTALDAVGPYEVFSRLPGASVEFVAADPGPVRTDNGMLTLLVERSLGQVEHPDVVLVPGGPGDVAARAGESVRDWLREVDRTSTWTTSVCTGSLILAATGLIQGRRAACHWAWRDLLALFEVIPDPARIVRDGNAITGGGVTAGLDFAFVVAAELMGEAEAQALQLGLEYAPEPPFDAGLPETAPPEILAQVKKRIDALRPKRFAEAQAAVAALAATSARPQQPRDASGSAS
jgi:putative intracellular protease/amidase